MQITRLTENINIGDKKNVLLKEIRETIKLENGFDAEIFIIAKGAKIHPSLIVGTEKIFEILIRNITSIEEGDFYIRFEEALKILNKEFLEFDENLKNEIKENMSLSIGVFLDDKLFLSQYGIDIEVYLIRSRHVSLVSTGLDENTKPNELFTNIANGKLENNDIVIWSTERLLRYVTKTDLAKHFSNTDMSESLNFLQQSISSEIITQALVIATKINVEDTDQYIEENEHPNGIKSNNKINKFKILINKLSEKSKLVHKTIKSGKLNTILEKLHINGYKPQFIAAGLVVVLLMALIFIQSNAKTRKEIKEMEAILNQVEVDINTAASKGTYDKETAVNILSKAETKAYEVFNSGYLRPKSSQIISEIEKQKDNLDNVKRIATPKLIVDLSDTNPQANILGLVKTLDGNIYAYEYNGLHIITGDQVSDTLKIDENEQVVSATFDEDNDQLLFLTSNSKIISYKNKNFEFVDTSDESWKKATKITAYSGKIYLLSPEDNQIYRYPSTRTGFGKSENYSVNGVVKDAIDFAIDGFVYLLNKNGNIQLLSRGENQNIQIEKNSIQELYNASKIFTEFEFPYVYVLDSEKNRIFIYSKDARNNNLIYQAQYVFDKGIDTIKDFTVDKNTKTLYLITKNKLYSVELN